MRHGISAHIPVRFYGCSLVWLYVVIREFAVLVVCHFLGGSLIWWFLSEPVRHRLYGGNAPNRHKSLLFPVDSGGGRHLIRQLNRITGALGLFRSCWKSALLGCDQTSVLAAVVASAGDVCWTCSLADWNPLQFEDSRTVGVECRRLDVRRCGCVI